MCQKAYISLTVVQLSYNLLIGKADKFIAKRLETLRRVKKNATVTHEYAAYC